MNEANTIGSSRRKLLLSLFALIVGVCAAGVVVSTATQSEITIRVALLGSPDDEDYDGALVLKDFVESRTNGRVEVQVFPSGQFCSNERECLEGLQSGILEVFMTTIGGLGNVYGPAQVFDLPYAFRDDRVAECVFDGPIAAHLRKAVLDASLGMRLMTISNTGGWRNLATTDKMIRTPGDLEGQKIRTTSAPIQQELVRQLGGSPTPIAWSEVYTGLATGVVDGTKNSIQDIVGMKFHEHIRFITLDGHAYMGALWWYSEAKWQTLPDSIRRVVFDGFHHLRTVTRALPMRRQIASYEIFKDAGGTIYVPTAAEKQAFRAAASGMRSWFESEYGTEWLSRLDSAVRECETALDAAYESGS